MAYVSVEWSAWTRETLFRVPMVWYLTRPTEGCHGGDATKVLAVREKFDPIVWRQPPRRYATLTDAETGCVPGRCDHATILTDAAKINLPVSHRACRWKSASVTADADTRVLRFALQATVLRS